MIYFISDQHLGLGNPQSDKRREQALLKFLTAIKPHCERLFILGDLFDYWFEYTTVVQKQHIRTLAALADFADAGIPVDYLIGNHDFGHHTFFREHLGITIHPHDLDITLHSKRFYLAHGDGKAFNDNGYLFIRSILRNPLAQRAWRWLHPDIGIGIAAYFSRRSRAASFDKNYTSKRHDNELKGLEHFAAEKIAQGWDYVIMGHLHTVVEQVIERQSGSAESGLYVNLGTWLEEPVCAVFDGMTVRVLRGGDVLAQ